jgi:hypothetical protein
VEAVRHTLRQLHLQGQRQQQQQRRQQGEGCELTVLGKPPRSWILVCKHNTL